MKMFHMMACVSLGLALSSSAWAVCYPSQIGGGMLCCNDSHTVCHIQ